MLLSLLITGSSAILQNPTSRLNSVGIVKVYRTGLDAESTIKMKNKRKGQKMLANLVCINCNWTLFKFTFTFHSVLICIAQIRTKGAPMPSFMRPNNLVYSTEIDDLHNQKLLLNQEIYYKQSYCCQIFLVYFNINKLWRD